MRDIAETIRAGELNRDTMVLVRNWCAHARVEKFGGTGMIEMQTGLPIGHHGMRCDFAPEGGIASWDLRDAVIDFYDSNCAGCTHRKPLRLPNITKLIGERDRAHAARQEAEAAAEREVAEALAERVARRAALKPQLSAIAQTLLDDIGAYDEDRSIDNFDRVTQSARLAPEHFPPALTDYVLELAEDAPWFFGAALMILDAVGADDRRIAKIALATIAHGHPADLAVGKLMSRLDHLDAADVANVLGTAIHLARPEHDMFRGDDEPWPAHKPQLIEALYGRHPGAVLDAIETLLLSGRRDAVLSGGRGLQALQSANPSVARPILRTMVSVYVRADSLIADLKDGGDRLPDLAEALNDAFEDDPEAVDTLLQEFSLGASSSQRVRIYKVYALAMYVRHDAPPVDARSRRHCLALSRLVWAPTLERDDEALSELRSAFRSSSNGIVAIVRAQLDAFIGALFLLADRLVEIDSMPREAGENWLVVMERRNRRATLHGIMDNYVEWAAAAALGDETSIRSLVAMFDTIPEERDELRCVLLGATKQLAEDVTALKHILPHLYHALVGPSVLGRSYAATAVSELPYRARANVPDLLFEAFAALLWDQYVAVHKSAVRAMRRANVPEAHRMRAAHAILNLVFHYRVKSNEDDFLCDCVRLLAGMADLFGEQSGKVRSYLIEVALGIEPIHLRSEISSLAYTLGEDPAFAKLVARMLPELADKYNNSDEAIELLQKLSAEAVVTHAGLLHAAALQIVDEDLPLALGVIEAFLAAGALEQAIATSAVLQVHIGDTRRMRRKRTLVAWPALAARYEQAILAGDDAQLTDIAGEWKAAATADAEDEKDSRERRSRSSLPFED